MKPALKNQAGHEDRLEYDRNLGNADWFELYATSRLRRLRSVLAPNGSSVPATMVVGSGPGTKTLDSTCKISGWILFIFGLLPSSLSHIDRQASIPFGDMFVHESDLRHLHERGHRLVAFGTD